jgi:hypothetical protein
MNNETQKKYTGKELLAIAKSIKENTKRHSNVRGGELELMNEFLQGTITFKQAQEAMKQAYGVKSYNVSSRMSVVLRDAVQSGKAELSFN